MLTEATVRNATVDDAHVLAEFNRNIALETEGLQLIPEVILDGVNALFENPARGFYVVAEVRGELVASLMVTTEWSDWRNGNFWWIQSVYVARDWRRRGLYRLLYRHIEQLAAQDENVCGFRLYVERENHVAQKTYTALGMTEKRYKMFEQLKAGREFPRELD